MGPQIVGDRKTSTACNSHRFAFEAIETGRADRLHSFTGTLTVLPIPSSETTRGQTVTLF